LRTVTATRYVTPLREGGSLPAIIEADDDGMYVLKFRGAGQGPKSLVAELIAGEIGRAAGLAVPDIVLVELDPELARTEPDPEIQALIRDSAGLNLALDYLPGSVMFDPVAEKIDPILSSSIVWFDAFVTNVDRTARNTNMLIWHRRLWLIDHGASLYFHHTWSNYLERARDPFAMIKDHVLLRRADAIDTVDAIMAARINTETIRNIVELIPESWLAVDSPFAGASEARKAYSTYLSERLQSRQIFVEEAVRARSIVV